MGSHPLDFSSTSTKFWWLRWWCSPRFSNWGICGSVRRNIDIGQDCFSTSPRCWAAFAVCGAATSPIFSDARRILTWSILVYTAAAVAAAYSTTLPELLTFRTLCYAGVCVEFVAAVAWLAELFQEPKTREAVLGYTQMCSSLGGVLVSGVFFLASRYGGSLPAIHGAHAAWRYTLLSGVAPALPLIIIRPFLPESPEWYAKRAAGTLKRPSIGELFGPQFRRVTIVTTLLFACAYGAAIGTIQQSPQIAGGMPEVAALPTAERGQATSSVSGSQELGGLAGRFLMASLALVIVSRSKLLRMFLIPGLLLVPFVFLYTSTHSLTMFRVGIFLAGVFTVGQLNFLGNYLPRVFPRTFARHRRRIRRECRRAYDGRVCYVYRHASGRCHARKYSRARSSHTRRALWACWCMRRRWPRLGGCRSLQRRLTIRMLC